VALNKIANDIRLMSCGPRAGFAELEIPDVALRATQDIIWRDPCAAPIVPFAVIRAAASPMGAVGVVTPALVLFGAQLAGPLPWIALSAAEAPGCLATALVARGPVECRKSWPSASRSSSSSRYPWPRWASHPPGPDFSAFLFGVAATASSAPVNPRQ
jgi:hypothetical protein